MECVQFVKLSVFILMLVAISCVDLWNTMETTEKFSNNMMTLKT